jgi:hypothetical protein
MIIGSVLSDTRLHSGSVFVLPRESNLVSQELKSSVLAC